MLVIALSMSHHMVATCTHTQFLLFICVVYCPLFVCFLFLLLAPPPSSSSLACLSFSSISTSIYSQFVFLCSHITKVMGLLVKNIFAFATYFSAAIFHPHMYVFSMYGGDGCSRHVCKGRRQKWEEKGGKKKENGK